MGLTLDGNQRKHWRMCEENQVFFKGKFKAVLTTAFNRSKASALYSVFIFYSKLLYKMGHYFSDIQYLDLLLL